MELSTEIRRTQREIIEDAFHKFVSYVETTEMPPADETTNAICFSAREAGIDSDVVFYLTSALPEFTLGMFGADWNTGESFIAFQIFDLETPMATVSVARFRETFTHEYQHYFDFVRKGQPTEVPNYDPNHPSPYYNHPYEFNAYYQQAVAKFYQMHRNGVTNLDGPLQERLKWVREQCFDGDFVENLYPKNIRKLMKRLYKETLSP